MNALMHNKRLASCMLVYVLVHDFGSNGIYTDDIAGV
jgi:hypothetical protein